jgi:hypothetical protein
MTEAVAAQISGERQVHWETSIEERESIERRWTWSVYWSGNRQFVGMQTHVLLAKKRHGVSRCGEIAPLDVRRSLSITSPPIMPHPSCYTTSRTYLYSKAASNDTALMHCSLQPPPSTTCSATHSPAPFASLRSLCALQFPARRTSTSL